MLETNRFPLPNGVLFQAPNSILGALQRTGLYNWTVTAADQFNEAYGYVLVNCTNVAPVPVLGGAALDLGRVWAARALFKDVPLATLFLDGDDDPLRYQVNVSSMPPWMTAAVTPGILTKAPQTLRLSGVVPPAAQGTNITVQIECSDGFATASMPAQLRVARGQRPRLVKPFLAYATAPTEALTVALNMNEYWEAPDGDTPLHISYTVVPAVAWLTITVNPGANGDAPTLAVAASRDKLEDVSSTIEITASNSLGNATTASVSVSILRTDFQKMRQIALIASAALSVLMSVVGAVLYYPHLINMWRGRRSVVPCPRRRCSASRRTRCASRRRSARYRPSAAG